MKYDICFRLEKGMLCAAGRRVVARPQKNEASVVCLWLLAENGRFSTLGKTVARLSRQIWQWPWSEDAATTTRFNQGRIIQDLKQFVYRIGFLKCFVECKMVLSLDVESNGYYGVVAWLRESGMFRLDCTAVNVAPLSSITNWSNEKF